MSKRRNKLATAAKPTVNNGLTEALFPAGMAGYNFGVPMGQQTVSQTATVTANMRGYLVSNMRQFLSEAYVEIGLVQNVINIPVDDAFRGGVEVLSKQLSAENVAELQRSMERHNDLTSLGQALKWNRLFGGAGLIIETGQDPTHPLSEATITEDSPLIFKPADLWELFYDSSSVESIGLSARDPKFEFYNYYGVKIHKSRVLQLKGLTAPSYVRPRLRGWGFSVVEALIRAINQYIKGTTVVFELLDEAKLDVYMLKNLADTLMGPNNSGVQKVQQRVQMANTQKNFQHAIVLDGDDKYEQKTLNFAGLADILQEIRVQVASDLRIPMTKLFGIPVTGLVTDDGGSIENYNAMVQGEVREKAKFDIIRIVGLRCQQLFGFVPDDIEIKFQPLRVMSAEQEETIKTSKFNRLLQAQQAGLITTIEFRDACNKDTLLIIPLDTTAGAIDDLEDENAGDVDDEKEEKE